MNTYIKQDYSFLIYIIDYYVSIIKTNPSGNYGGTMKVGMEFFASVNSIDTLLLTIEGVVAFIYYETYKLIMPSILVPMTYLEASRIYEIYDVMGIDRPTLTIV
jgi:hypothetical protein